MLRRAVYLVSLIIVIAVGVTASIAESGSGAPALTPHKLAAECSAAAGHPVPMIRLPPIGTGIHERDGIAVYATPTTVAACFVGMFMEGYVGPYRFHDFRGRVRTVMSVSPGPRGAWVVVLVRGPVTSVSTTALGAGSSLRSLSHGLYLIWDAQYVDAGWPRASTTRGVVLGELVAFGPDHVAVGSDELFTCQFGFARGHRCV